MEQVDKKILLSKHLIKAGFRPLNGHQFSIWLDEFECISLFIEINHYGIRVGLKDVWTRSGIPTIEQLESLYYGLTLKKLNITETL